MKKSLLCFLFVLIFNITFSYAGTVKDLPKNNPLRYYAEKASAAYSSKNYYVAIENYSKALEIHKVPDGYLYRGYSYLYTKQYELAKKDFITVIALCQYYNDDRCKEYSYYAADLLNLLDNIKY